MILGIGVDLAETSRIERAIRRHRERFLRRVFTEVERAYCEKFARSVDHYAARFAAKEAVSKALGTGLSGGVRWVDIEVRNEASGKPYVQLAGRAREVFEALGGKAIRLSLSHTGPVAAATAVLEGTRNGRMRTAPSRKPRPPKNA